MAPVRILVDGYSLLHRWPALAPGRPRHSAAARDELVRALTHYRDATGTPITVIFDGGGAPPGTPESSSTPEMEVLFSRAGQTADDVIERVTHRLSGYGEVLVVTDDRAERDTVISLGGTASSCLNFIQSLEDTVAGFQRELKQHNRRERERFKRRARR
jgi:predicted RNA-binding protein with PIN domain